MRKQEFLDALKMKLSGLPKQDVEDSLGFYSEMIDDKMEDGRTEEDAVSEIGSVGEISAQIIADIPLARIAKERVMPKRRLKTWEIVLLAIGSPAWLALLFATFAVILSLYLSVWSVVISLCACFISLAACSVAGITGGIVFALTSNSATGIATIGAGVFCMGLSILFSYLCKACTIGTLQLTKKLVLWCKLSFIRKETV